MKLDRMTYLTQLLLIRLGVSIFCSLGAEPLDSGRAIALPGHS